MTSIEYSGRDNLQAMYRAVNYNRFITTLVIRSAANASTVIDFGAGAGTFARPVAEAGFNVSCIESDPQLSEQLRDDGFDVAGDLDNTPDATVDYIYSLNVLEHIKDDEDILTSWYRKLRPGGSALVYVPAFQFLFSQMDVKVGHVRRYTKGSLRSRLLKTGFEIEFVRYADSLGYFATIAYKLFGNCSGNLNPRTIEIYDRYFFPVSRVLDALFGKVFGKNVYAYVKKRTL